MFLFFSDFLSKTGGWQGFLGVDKNILAYIIVYAKKKLIYGIL